MTNENSFGWVWILFIVLIFFFFFQNNNCGWGRNGNCIGSHECGATSNCDIQKSEITNSARTQYLVQEKGFQNELLTLQNQISINANTNFWGIQQLNQRFEDERFKVQQLQNENSMLKNQIYNDAKFNDLSQKIDACCCESSKQFQRIELTGLKQPPFFPFGFTPNGYLFNANCNGYNFNNGCNNGCC